MKHLWLHSLGLTLVVLAAPAYAQPTDAPKVGVGAGVSVQGKIVRLQAPDQYIVQTPAGKEYSFYTGKDSRYLSNDKAIRYSDLRVGSNVTTSYITEGDRYIANTVTVGGAIAVPGNEEPTEKTTQPARELSVQGQITGVRAPDQLTVKTEGDKEVTIKASPTTRVSINGKEGRFTELRVAKALYESDGLLKARIVPRRLFNSFAGEYREGDFIMHFAGCTREAKLKGVQEAARLAWTKLSASELLEKPQNSPH